MGLTRFTEVTFYFLYTPYASCLLFLATLGPQPFGLVSLAIYTCICFLFYCMLCFLFMFGLAHSFFIFFVLPHILYFTHYFHLFWLINFSNNKIIRINFSNLKPLISIKGFSKIKSHHFIVNSSQFHETSIKRLINIKLIFKMNFKTNVNQALDQHQVLFQLNRFKIFFSIQPVKKGMGNAYPSTPRISEWLAHIILLELSSF